MSLADYLAKNYLTADNPQKPEKKSKKRKRKETTGLIIADDDVLGWSPNDSARAQDEDAPTTVYHPSADFRKAAMSKWQTIGAPTPSSSDQAAADAIIASTAAENAALYLADEDVVVEDEEGTGGGNTAGKTKKMESGAHVGLQTAAQVSAQLSRQEAKERARFMQDEDARMGKGADTIFRDASGRIITVAMKRAEARKRAEEEAANAAAEMEQLKGDVQRAEQQRRKEKVAEAKFLPVARYEDDVELNEELKERQRWDDPAAQFLSKKKAGKSVSGKPLYAGPAMPNRYGIRPGHNWDGVDRGNGFEKKYFAVRNRVKNLKNLDYAWQMDE